MPAKDSTPKYLFVHKTRVHVNNRQANFFRGCAGFRRFAYNWALAYISEGWKEREERISPSKADIAFNAVKRDLCPWAYGYPSCVGQEAIKSDLKSGFDHFFRRLKRGETPGYPKFKGKHSTKTLKFTNAVLRDKHVCGQKLTLPKSHGVVRLGCQTRHNGRLLSTTISESGGKWYAAMLYELDYEPEYHTAPPEVVGIDLGVAKRVTLSTGEIVNSPEKLKTLDKRKRYIQRKMAKRKQPRKGKKPSKRWLKLNQSAKRIDRQRSALRKEQANQITAKVARENSLVVIEDLKLSNMTKSAKGSIAQPGKNVKAKSGLNRELLNAGLYEIRRQLEYKTQRHKGMLLAVNPAYTSQECSECGHTSKENRKTQAVFTCNKCGFSANADYNASINIMNRGILELSAETLKAGPG